MRDKIKLQSTGKTKDGKPTGTYYVTTVNKKKAMEKKAKPSKSTIDGKLKVKKYDRRAVDPKTGKAGCHVTFTQTKLPSSG